MDWKQLHLALNHLPVIGLPLMVVLLFAGWCRKSQEVMRAALWFMAVLSVMAILVKFTGDFAAADYPQKTDEVKALVTRHEQTGDQVTTAVFVLALVSALAIWLARGKRELKTWAVMLVLALGVVTSALYARCAHAGGQISHPELRK